MQFVPSRAVRGRSSTPLRKRGRPPKNIVPHVVVAAENEFQVSEEETEEMIATIVERTPSSSTAQTTR